MFIGYLRISAKYSQEARRLYHIETQEIARRNHVTINILGPDDCGVRDGVVFVEERYAATTIATAYCFV